MPMGQEFNMAIGCVEAGQRGEYKVLKSDTTLLRVHPSGGGTVSDCGCPSARPRQEERVCGQCAKRSHHSGSCSILLRHTWKSKSPMSARSVPVGCIGCRSMRTGAFQIGYRLSQSVSSAPSVAGQACGDKAPPAGLSRFQTALKAGWQGCAYPLVDGPLSRPHATVGIHGRIRPCEGGGNHSVRRL